MMASVVCITVGFPTREGTGNEHPSPEYPTTNHDATGDANAELHDGSSQAPPNDIVVPKEAAEVNLIDEALSLKPSAYYN